MEYGGALLALFGGVTYRGPLKGIIAAERMLGLKPDPIRRLAARGVAVSEDARRHGVWRCPAGAVWRRDISRSTQGYHRRGAHAWTEAGPDPPARGARRRGLRGRQTPWSMAVPCWRCLAA